MKCEQRLQSHSITLLSAYMQENPLIQGEKLFIRTNSSSHQHAMKKAFRLVWEHLCRQKSSHRDKGWEGSGAEP